MPLLERKPRFAKKKLKLPPARYLNSSPSTQRTKLRVFMLPLFAVTALEKAQKISPQFWLKIAAFIVALVVAIFLIRGALRMNKMILAIVTFIVVGLIGFNWIYERNEPAFLTPVVNVVAPFFPGKGAYEGKQQQDPVGPGVHKNAPTPATQPTK